MYANSTPELLFSVMVLIVGLTFGFVVDVAVRKGSKHPGLWLVLLLFLNLIVLPFYWYVRIWRRSEDPFRAAP